MISKVQIELPGYIAKHLIKTLAPHGDNACPPCEFVIDQLETALSEQSLDAAKEYEKCGAQDWAWAEDYEVIIYGECDLPKGHEQRMHQEMRDGRLWASWSGSSDSRAPGETNE